MGKIVLGEPPKFTRRTVTFRTTKPNGDDYLEISHGDTGERLLVLDVEEQTRKLVVNAIPGAEGIVVKTASGEILNVAPSIQPEFLDVEGLRSWKSENGTFTCWLPNGKYIELPVADEPGPFTPFDEVHEVLGQPELIFAIAFGIKHGKHSFMTGPTGTAKTTAYRWLAKQLNYNLVIQPIARGTESSHMVGEYLPAGEAGNFDWTDGPVTEATRASQSHPTILLFDEINRIGNIAEFARIYSLLDDTRMLEIKERRGASGDVERIDAGQLYVGATSNPSDSQHEDYLGVQDMDPALNSRFGVQYEVRYPKEEVEIKALMLRVDGLAEDTAKKMVEAATQVRGAMEIRFPVSFRELEVWARAMPYYGYRDAAEIAVITKAPSDYRGAIREMLALQG